MMRTIFIVGLLCGAGTAQAGGIQSFTNDSVGYDAATGGITDVFIDFETDRFGNLLDFPELTQVDGALFSNDVVYSSNGGSTVNIAMIENPDVRHEIGPASEWDGMLRWDYSQVYRATSFTGVVLEADAQIDFFRDGSLVASANVGGDGFELQFFGFVLEGGFDAVELTGDFYAIDAHASTLIPAPSALGMLGLGGLMASRRRR